MNKVSHIITMLVMVCTSQACLKIPAPSFELTHQAMLEKTLKEVQLARVVSTKIRPGARVALIPVANTGIKARDFYMMEDVFTQQLVKAGYSIQQKPDSIALKSGAEPLEAPSAVTVEGYISGETGQPMIQKITPDESVNLGITEWDHIKALLPNADAFIVYNVHEYGKLLQRSENVPKMVTREFRLKMTVRLIKASDMSILAVEDVNSFKTDDLHMATIRALDEYNYSSNNYTYPFLSDGSSSGGSNWLSPATTDWDFIAQVGTFGTETESMKYLWFKGGVEANFGRLVFGLSPNQLEVDVSQPNKKTVTTDLDLTSNILLQYTKPVMRIGGKGRLYAGGGLTRLSQGKVSIDKLGIGKSFTNKMFGVNGILNLEYPIYPSSWIQIMLTGAIQLNLTLPQDESIDDSDFTINQQNVIDVLLGITAQF